MLKSMWLETIEKKNYKQLTENKKVKLLIIGGGISGISCAYECSSYFSNITLVTMNEFYSGTTGFTTAKVTSQHSDIYNQIISLHNEEKARLYYDFNQSGLARAEEIIKKEAIDCDFTSCDSYLYSYHKEDDAIQKEYEAYQKIGINGLLTKTNEFDSMALKVVKQAHFHPLKYLEALLDKCTANGVEIYEHTKIESIHKKTAITEDGYEIEADIIIVATNYPIYPNVNIFFTKLVPSKSYVVVGTPKKELALGNYINPLSPILSLRHYDGQLVIGGMSHDSSEMKDESNELNKLTEIGKNRFEIDEFNFAWSTRDYTSMDLLPLIGKLATDIYTLTGYGKWGMTNSIAGAVLIRDLILGNETKYDVIFDPCRSMCNKDFFKYNTKMVSTIVKSRKNHSPFEQLKPKEGNVFKLGCKRYGAYRDEFDQLFVVKATCTHLGCGLQFDKVNRTYDCPCHGSKFNYDGTVLAGPAKRHLTRLRLPDDKDLKE